MTKQSKSPAEMTPVAKATGANPKGVDNSTIGGIRLAQAFIKQDHDAAELSVKTGESLKARLIKVSKLTKDEHKAFTDELNAEREALKKRAKDAGYEKLDDYFKKGARAGQIDYYMQTSISLWIKFSVAFSLGWQMTEEEIKRGNWQDMSKAARNFPDELKRRQAQAGSVKVESDTERMAREVKARTELVQKVEKAAEQTITKRNEAGTLELSDTAKDSLPDVVMAYCKWANVEQLDAIIAKLQLQRDLLVKAREEAAKATAKAAKSSDEAIAEEKTANVGERAEAKSDKRTRKTAKV